MTKEKYDAKIILDDAFITPNGDTLCVDLKYPRNRTCKYISVGLEDGRAADSVRISYDFDRDGFKIEQASVFEGEGDFDPDWQEVAFVQAWGREKK